MEHVLTEVWKTIIFLSKCGFVDSSHTYWLVRTIVRSKYEQPGWHIFPTKWLAGTKGRNCLGVDHLPDTLWEYSSNFLNIFFNWVQTLKWSVSPLSLTTYGIPSGELCPAKFVFNMGNGSWSNKNSKKTARFHEILRGKRFEIQTLQSMTLWVRWFLNIMFVGDLLWQICLHWVRGTRFDQVWLNGVSCFNYYHLQERRWRSQLSLVLVQHSPVSFIQPPFWGGG